MRHLALLALLLAASASPASADGVPPPPDDCPPGSFGTTDHGGARCVPAPCQDDAQCELTGTLGLGVPAGARCRNTSLCLERRFISQGGRYPGGELSPPIEIQVAVGECDADGSCERGECSPATRCVSGEPPPPSPAPADVPASPTAPPPATPSTGGGCGCALGGRDAPPSAWTLAGLALAVARPRSRRRRSSAPAPAEIC